jgi:hypothetical protein
MQSPCWHNHSATQEIPRLYGTRQYMIEFERTRHWILRSDESHILLHCVTSSLTSRLAVYFCSVNRMQLIDTLIKFRTYCRICYMGCSRYQEHHVASLARPRLACHGSCRAYMDSPTVNCLPFVRKSHILFAHDQQVQYPFWSTARNSWMHIMQLRKTFASASRRLF